ncbi:MAG TPA: serine/threonine-protein kinase [Lacunisphaera sp.]|jgi:serine/threonine protein kinase
MNEPAEEEERIFAEALALPAAERVRYLDRACGSDNALRGRIEALLSAHESAGDFMAPPREISLGEKADESSPHGPVDREGTRIGRYKLLQKIGEGGCGVVWMAEQEEPVRRRVALKVIKLGMDTKNVIARFEAERQALALMDHPNIARVLDAGATDAGRPFFVMELVPGVPITKYCDQHNLSTAARLGLFTQVCQAVQHAHQKGVIHRDLKPSNILVTLHDGEPTPKVIDFGIAKATQERLTDHTLFTAFEQFIGTPAYMSPEQAEMSGIDVDTRSDIYSLGVLLYELLTGRPPFDPKSLFQAGLDEIRRIIREVEPVKPSTRLNTLGDADRNSVARQRGISPAQLSPLIRGDLDWIVMKALEKNRSRRYETANGLALDIQRHLQNEPVSARPPTTTYRVSRFVRRNRFAVAAVSAVALALVIGTVVSTMQALRAKRAERLAGIERSKAIDERAHAEDLLGFMLGDLRTQLAKVGRLDVLESVGDKAMGYFSSRETSGMDDPTLARRAKALTQIGEIRMDQARYSDAAAAFAEAYKQASALVARHPRDGNMIFERGQAEYWNGFVHWQRGELPEATDWLNRYRDTSLELASLDPSRLEWQSELAWGHHNIAVLFRERGELDSARNEFAAELNLLEKLLGNNRDDLELRYRVSDVHSWLGGLAEQEGNYVEAIRQYSSQTEQLRQIANAAPRTAQWRFHLANAILFQTDMAVITGQLVSASEKLKEARKLLDELVVLDPANNHWKIASLNAQLKEAMLSRRQGAPGLGSNLAENVLVELEHLSGSESSDRAFTLWFARALRVIAQMRDDAKKPGAMTAITRALELDEQLIRKGGQPSDELAGECAMAHVQAGKMEADAGDTTRANLQWQRGEELTSKALAKTRDWRLLDPAARVTFFLGQTSEAQSIAAQLNRLGYVPLEPWPEAIKISSPQPQPK